MLRTIKLVSYFYLYQLLFTAIITLPGIWTQLMKNGGDVMSLTKVENTSITAISLAMVLSNIAMIWHLLHFKYVKFNRKSFGEVSGKTIGLSIPFILAGMVFINLCCEWLNLSDDMQDIFFGMSRNAFGILSAAVMAPLVEELLFRGAIQGHLLRIGVKPLYAIFISSAIFGIIHMNPAQIPFAFAIGLIFGWLYYRTGSVVPGIIGHFINNSIACIQMATLTKEEFNTKTIEWLGEGLTYAIFALSFVVMMGMFLYLKKHLPAAPVYTEEQDPTSTTYHIMKKNETQGKDPIKKETMYIYNAARSAIFWTIGLLYLTYKGSNKTLKDKPEIILNNICEFAALLICTVLINIIAYNVKRKRIFIKANAHLIKAIGFVVGISGFLTSVICENLLDQKAWTFYYYPKFYLMIIGLFIVAIGYVFQLAIKIKEEQDLTI